MMAYIPDSLYGSFLPTTRVFDEQNIRELDISSPKFKEFLVGLQQALNEISIQSNEKDFGRYVLQEIINGQLFFPDPTISRTASNVQNPDYRQGFRDTVNVGALHGIGVPTTTAHHITFDSNIIGTRVYGCGTNPGVALQPIPNEDIKITTTDVVITPSIDLSAYTTSVVIIEIIRN